MIESSKQKLKKEKMWKKLKVNICQKKLQK